MKVAKTLFVLPVTNFNSATFFTTLPGTAYAGKVYNQATLFAISSIDLTVDGVTIARVAAGGTINLSVTDAINWAVTGTANIALFESY